MKYAIVFTSKIGDFISVYHLVDAGPNGYFFMHRDHKDTVIFDDKLTAIEYLNTIKENPSFIRNACTWSNEYIINNIGVREIYTSLSGATLHVK